MPQFAHISNIGNRTTNDDCCAYACADSEYCFAVADGLGGHSGGDIASYTAVNNTINLFQKDSTNPDFFKNAFSSSHKLLKSLQKERSLPDGIKTTMVVLTVSDSDGIAKWAHIGDSRLYMFDENKLLLQTQDHTVTNKLLSDGLITQEELRYHPAKNRLLSVLGTNRETLNFELSPVVHIKTGNAFLLCTDGFWTLIDEKAMVKALKHSDTPQKWLDKMCKTVIKNGKYSKMDNFTAIAVMI